MVRPGFSKVLIWYAPLWIASAAMQVTVIFLVDVDKCLPNKDDWPQLWAQQQAWKQAKKDHEDELVGPHQQKPWHCVVA
jgi:hypothetical protein